jgi:hypothetical protein
MQTQLIIDLALVVWGFWATAKVPCDARNQPGAAAHAAPSQTPRRLLTGKVVVIQSEGNQGN